MSVAARIVTVLSFPKHAFLSRMLDVKGIPYLAQAEVLHKGQLLLLYLMRRQLM